MPVPAPSCSGCSTRPPPPSARSPTPAPPPASTASAPRRSPTPTGRAPDPATQLTMKEGRRIPPGRNASAADPFYWLEREELHCTTLGPKGLPCAGSALPPPSPPCSCCCPPRPHSH